LALWNKQGGLTCAQCEEQELISQGVTSCDTCKKPRPLEANYTVLELYGYSPIRPIPMTDGLVMLDTLAVEFLFKIHEIPHEEQKGILEKMSIYHNELYSKDRGKKGSDNDIGKGSK